MMARLFLLLPLIGACSDDVPVSWACTYDDAGTLATWDDGEMPCSAAQSSGYQVLDTLRADCEAAGEADCSCSFTDVSLCGGDWND